MVDEDDEEQEESEDEQEQVEEEAENSANNSSGATLFIPIIGATAILAIYSIFWLNNWILGISIGMIGFMTGMSIKINNQWEEAVILRFGKFRKMVNAGLFIVIPFVDEAIRRDKRVKSTTFSAEESLTKDNVPVNVDAVIFWKVTDTKKSVFAVQDYFDSISRASMTCLRDTIGKSTLSDMLSDRETIDKQLKTAIDGKAERWGLDVESVEIREVKIPKDLQDAISRQAQAEREKTARITLAGAEVETSKKMMEAAENYGKNENAMKLRWMNQIHEIGLHGEGKIIVIPADMPVAGVGGLLGLAEQNAKKSKMK